MAKRGGAHKALNKPPIQDAFWSNKGQPMTQVETSLFEAAKKEYWSLSCFIYSCLKNSFKSHHSAAEYYLLLHQKNISDGVTEYFDASKLISDICDHFKDSSEVLKTKLSLEFSSFQVKEGETVEEYSTRFERLIQNLALVNVVNDDATVQATFQNGLVGNEFIFVQTLLTMTKYKTFQKMKASIISYSKSSAAQNLRAQALQLVKSAATLPTADQPQNTGEVNLTGDGRRKKNKRGERWTPQEDFSGCFICNSKKHRCANCPERNKNRRVDDDSGSQQAKRPKKKEEKRRTTILSRLRDHHSDDEDE